MFEILHNTISLINNIWSAWKQADRKQRRTVLLQAYKIYHLHIYTVIRFVSKKVTSLRYFRV